MPFGLTNAPATFQAAMTTEFRHMLDRFILIYLDDILVYSRSLDEHVEHRRTVLERLRQAKYKANRDKYEFAWQELEYLGHYVTPQDIRPLADKIEALRVWPEPTNTTDVRSFMGLAGYYQRFITGYSRIAAPMTRLESPKVPFVFDDDARRSFQALKTAMLMAPVLSIYDPTLPTGVTTDASGYGIGAVLEQRDGDDWNPVECFSHKVPPINSLDDARKKELLAFVMNHKRWRHFLLGRRFTWVTDNNPLTYYKAQDTESGTKMKPSSARHPQTDGQTDRAHQTAQMMLRTLICPDQKDWVDRLPDIEFAYNTSVHPAIGVTPFELHHGGRKGRIFTDLLLPRPADIDAACSPASVRKYRELLAQARANMQKAQVRMHRQANRRRVPCPIRAGALVWVSAKEFALEQDVSRKLLPKWFGPWPVTSAAGDEPNGPSFVINIPAHLTVHPVFHSSKLATYTPAKSDDFPGRRSQDPPSMDGHQEVDRVITDRKYSSKPRQYNVTFRACDPDDTRWVSGTNLKASAPLIYAHCERQRLAQGPSQPAPTTRTVVPPSDR
uniref:Reverse transcriptase domain-containing protein n=1 Tax=Chara braunii TaxID=69332 RepID=A0A388M3G2_CHABU